MSKIEKECATSDQVRCDVVTLYQGGKYNLYKYRRFQDVRLVFAPEHAIAFFGGDPDNFEFPRYDLDVSFVRVYQDGKPATTDELLPVVQGRREGGRAHLRLRQPGPHLARADRGRAGVPARRGHAQAAHVAGRGPRHDQRVPEARPRAAAHLQQHEVRRGERASRPSRAAQEALLDKKFFASKVAAEQELRQKVDANPELKKKYGAAWDEIAKAQEQLKNIRKELSYLEQGAGLQLAAVQHRPGAGARRRRAAQGERPAPARVHRREPARPSRPSCSAPPPSTRSWRSPGWSSRSPSCARSSARITPS